MIACGALVREIRSLTPSWDPTGRLDVHYLPAPLHNRPEQIVPALRESIDAHLTEAHDRVLIGYADCGTGGLLDAAISDMVADGLDVERIPGAHCYEFFTGSIDFAELHEAELGTFFLTDYLARHFDQLIWKTFKLDKHPELIGMMFAHYKRVVYLAQTSDPEQLAALTEKGRDAASQLGLEFEVRHTGLDPFHDVVVEIDRHRTTAERI